MIPNGAGTILKPTWHPDVEDLGFSDFDLLCTGIWIPFFINVSRLFSDNVSSMLPSGCTFSCIMWECQPTVQEALDSLRIMKQKHFVLHLKLINFQIDKRLK